MRLLRALILLAVVGVVLPDGLIGVPRLSVAVAAQQPPDKPAPMIKVEGTSLMRKRAAAGAPNRAGSGRHRNSILPRPKPFPTSSAR